MDNFVGALLVQNPEMRNDVAQLRAVCDIFTAVTMLCFVCLFPARSLLHKELGLYKSVYLNYLVYVIQNTTFAQAKGFITDFHIF